MRKVLIVSCKILSCRKISKALAFQMMLQGFNRIPLRGSGIRQ